MERTKARPLASGELSQFQALCLLGVNLSLSLGILLQLNMYRYTCGSSFSVRKVWAYSEHLEQVVTFSLYILSTQCDES